MATYTLDGAPSLQSSSNSISRAKFIIDATKANAGSGYAASDVIQLCTVNNCIVFNVYTTVVTPEGGTATADIGDGTDPNGYNDAVDFNATAGTIESGVDATDALINAEGNSYAASDTIDITLDHALDTCVIEVVVTYLSLD
jgi:hypothetical protein